MKLFAEEVNLVAGFVPVNMATGANNGDWVSLKNYRHCSTIVYKGAGGASEPITITMSQATAIAGTGSKGLNFTRVHYKNNSDLTLVGTYTTATQSAASTFVFLGPDGGSEGIVCIDVNAEDLDVENGFDCVRVSIADVGNQSVLGCAFYLLSGARYLPPLSAIAD